MPSSIGTATANLHTLLEAAAWTAPTPQITFGPPDAYEEQQVVAVLNVEEPDESAAALGPLAKREEQYVVVVRAKAHDPAATTGKEVFLRVLALREVVRATVVANPTLATAVRECDVVGGGPTGGPGLGIVLPAEGGGFVAFSDARVLCKARIT